MYPTVPDEELVVPMSPAYRVILVYAIVALRTGFISIGAINANSSLVVVVRVAGQAIARRVAVALATNATVCCISLVTTVKHQRNVSPSGVDRMVNVDRMDVRVINTGWVNSARRYLHARLLDVDRMARVRLPDVCVRTDTLVQRASVHWDAVVVMVHVHRLDVRVRWGTQGLAVTVLVYASRVRASGKVIAMLRVPVSVTRHGRAQHVWFRRPVWRQDVTEKELVSYPAVVVSLAGRAAHACAATDAPGAARALRVDVRVIWATAIPLVGPWGYAYSRVAAGTGHVVFLVHVHVTTDGLEWCVQLKPPRRRLRFCRPLQCRPLVERSEARLVTQHLTTRRRRVAQ